MFSFSDRKKNGVLLRIKKRTFDHVTSGQICLEVHGVDRSKRTLIAKYDSQAMSYRFQPILAIQPRQAIPALPPKKRTSE